MLTWKQKYERNKEIVNNIKDVPCADCGREYPPYVMDFDHVRGEKRTTVNRLMCKTIKTLLKEIEKCDIVCANCHRIRHYS